ncbi:MAG: Trm112 family protein [Desulfurococcales archaeon]|nr:Trm112 family protein [Desulfurococcales archaeon]
MRYALLNLLACPMCRSFPLKLYILEKRTLEKDFKVQKPFCDTYCGLKEKPIKELKETDLPCDTCVKTDIVAAVLVCPECSRWYPVINGIPLMYPDDRRTHPRVQEREKEFLRKYYELMPEELRHIIDKGKK